MLSYTNDYDLVPDWTSRCLVHGRNMFPLNPKVRYRKNATLDLGCDDVTGSLLLALTCQPASCRQILHPRACTSYIS